MVYIYVITIVIILLISLSGILGGLISLIFPIITIPIISIIFGIIHEVINGKNIFEAIFSVIVELFSKNDNELDTENHKTTEDESNSKPRIGGPREADFWNLIADSYCDNCKHYQYGRCNKSGEFTKPKDTCVRFEK